MIVLPMLGRSSRFYKAGYTLPKYKLPLGQNGKIVFDHVLNSFRNYFDNDLFILLCRSDAKDKTFLKKRMKMMGVRRFKVIEYGKETGGQAESVELSLRYGSENEELYIFNIDTILYNFEKDPSRKEASGYLEVFKGKGDHWSFVEPNPNHLFQACQVREKERISDLCSNGLYYFSSVCIYNKALKSYRLKNKKNHQELYVAPLYNELIESGMVVNYKEISKNKIGFCGVPEEYIELKKKYSKSFDGLS